MMTQQDGQPGHPGHPATSPPPVPGGRAGAGHMTSLASAPYPGGGDTSQGEKTAVRGERTSTGQVWMTAETHHLALPPSKGSVAALKPKLTNEVFLSKGGHTFYLSTPGALMGRFPSPENASTSPLLSSTRRSGRGGEPRVESSGACPPVHL